MTATIAPVKLNIARGALLAKLKFHRNVSNAPLVPILENVKIVLDDEGLTLTTSNLQQVIETSLLLPQMMADTIEMCIPYKKLLALLESLPEQGLQLTYNPENYRLKIKTQQGNYELAGEDPTPFPKPFVPEGKKQWLSLSSQVLRTALESTLYATSKEYIKPAWQGIYMEEDGRLMLTATDGNRLHHAQIEDYTQGESGRHELISSDSLSVLLSILPKETPLEFYSSERFVWVECEDFLFSSVKIDERYPDFRNAIPQNSPCQLEINRADWLSVLGRLSLFADKENRIAVEINLKSVSFEVVNESSGNNCREKLDIETGAGDVMKIGFSYVYLRDALRHLTGEVLTMEYTAPNRAVLIRQNNDFALVMPLVLNTYQ